MRGKVHHVHPRERLTVGPPVEQVVVNLTSLTTFTNVHQVHPNIWLQVGGRRPERGWALAGGMAQGKGTHLKEAAPGLKSRDPNVAGDSVNAWMAT